MTNHPEGIGRAFPQDILLLEWEGTEDAQHARHLEPERGPTGRRS